MFRLHREALKQAAVDPTTGKIDISILTTGISGAARKQRAERAKAMYEIIKSKGKVTIKLNKLFEEARERSPTVNSPYPILHSLHKAAVIQLLLNEVFYMCELSCST